VTNRESKSLLKNNLSRQPSISDRESINILNNIQNISYSNNTKNVESNQNVNKFSNNENDFDISVPRTLQIKIINWLISLNMLKEGSIKPVDIPRMCANGVFLSDLINRLEGVILLKLFFNSIVLIFEIRD